MLACAARNDIYPLFSRNVEQMEWTHNTAKLMQLQVHSLAAAAVLACCIQLQAEELLLPLGVTPCAAPCELKLGAAGWCCLLDILTCSTHSKTCRLLHPA